MNLCSDGHDEVCYEVEDCPACSYGDKKYKEGYDNGWDGGFANG